jgi:hypothetical protein
MSEKSKQSAKVKPRHVIRCRQISANIYFRQANSGHEFFDYLLERQWQSLRSSKVLKGTTLFEANEDDAIECIRKACEWIRLQGAVPQSTQEGPNE